MSVREDLIIQADDITIVQGEKAKDYNVIVTSNDDAPLSDVPVTIAFYNNDYSFERETVTNEYGVASVPIYLSGDAYFVDVHFKGNEQYNPQLITKEIIIEKFEKMVTFLEKVQDPVIPTITPNVLPKYYSVKLYDEYKNPIINKPVQITVKTVEEEPTTLAQMVIKTNNDGIIDIPYATYNENVEIMTFFKGGARYKESMLSEIVSFDEISETKQTIDYNIDITGGVITLQYKIGNSDWVNIFDGGSEPLSTTRIVINQLNNDNELYYGNLLGLRYDIYDFDHDFRELPLDIGEYKITICNLFKNYYPITKTFEFNHSTDTRINTFNTYNVSCDNNVVGDIAHITLYWDRWERFDCDIYFGVGTTDYATSLEDFKTKSNYVIKLSNKSKDGNYEADIIFPNNGKYGYWVDGFLGLHPFCIVRTLSKQTSSKNNVAITQTGFGSQGQTYQDMQISVTNNNAEMHDKLNDYYIMRLMNTETNEEFYFYSYLIDNVTASKIQFLLTTGNWECYIITKATENYNGAYYVTNATLDIDSTINPPTSTIIAQAENYIDLGTDTPTFVDDTITTATTDDDIHSIMSLEFTNTNYYRLSFNAEVTGDTAIIYGADPTLETMDGLFINNDSITLYNDDIEMDKLIFDTPLFNQTTNNILFQRYGNQFTIFVNDEQVYKTELLSWNTFGVYQNATGSEIELSYFALEPYITTEITPSVADYDGTIFGSNIHLELDDNKLSLIDYGMLPQGAVGGGKVILNDVPLESANKYAIQLEMKYNNSRFERLNNLTGQMQMRVYEDIMSSDTVKDYEKTLCSPMPVPNSRTVFTRHSDEGTLYFVQDPLNANSSFLTNAYNQYKGGVEITTETGISLFNLDNAYSPVYVGNELVRAEFHRRSGFIRLARYDESTGDWVNVNTLKLRNYPQLSLNDYNDDYAEVQFGNTTWKFYRGRPFIVLNHSQDDLRIMNLVDRVYCETVENQRGMGYIMDYDPSERTTVTDENGTVLGNYSTFNPQLSIQQFKQELHIGENIRLDNFELYEADSNQNIGEVATNSQLGILNIDNDNALQIYKDDTDLALNFPSYSHYVERVNDTFTLSIDYLDCPFENIQIKARGFDDKGAVPVKDGIQYGIWEQTVNVEVDTTATDSVRATFTGCPSEVKYLDFVIIFNGANSTDIIMKDLMYYDGDAILNHDVDTSRAFAEQVTINFADTYFANIYDENSSCGLCIARPYQEPFTLTSLKASSETVLIPYMKKSTEWDKPSQVFLEYLNAKKQIIDIDWEN